jgi:hypothetical protein
MFCNPVTELQSTIFWGRNYGDKKIMSRGSKYYVNIMSHMLLLLLLNNTTSYAEET